MSNGGIRARAALALRVLLVFGVLATYPAAAAASVPHYYLNGTSEVNKVPEGLKVPTISFGTLTWTAVAPGKEGPVSCETAVGGFVENPVGGGAGKGQTSLFVPWNCERAVGCPTGAEIEFPAGSGKKVMEEPAVYPGGELDGVHEKILGESFPWPGELTEAVTGKIRAEMKGVVWIGACQVKKSRVEGSAPLGDGDGDSPQLVKRNTVCFTTTVSGEATGPLATWEPLTENGSQVGGPLTSKLNFSAFPAGHLLCEGEEGGGISEIITYEGHLSGEQKTFTYEGQELIDTH
jgi:hypothetical protein